MMQTQRLGFALLSLALPTSLWAQASAPKPDPVTGLSYLLDPNEALTGLVGGDFDGDGRMDLVATTDQGRAIVMYAAAERQHHRVITSPGDSHSLEEVLAAAAQRGPSPGDADRLLLETASGLWIGTLSEEEGEFAGELIPGTEELQAGTVLYDNECEQPWAIAWRVGAEGSWIQPLAFERSTGQFLLLGTALAVPQGVGAACAVDFDQDGLADLALTIPEGLVVIDALGGLLLVKLRPEIVPDPTLDALARVRDGDGAELLAWIDAAVPNVVLILDPQGAIGEQLELEGELQGPLLVADVDGNGRADLVLVDVPVEPLGEPEDLLIFLASDTLPRYSWREPIVWDTAPPVPGPLDDPGGVRGALLLDMDRDGDPDYVAVTEAEFLLTRQVTVDHRGLAPTVEPGLGAHESSARHSDIGGPEGRTTALVRLLQPDLWGQSGNALDSAEGLAWRVYARPEAEVTERRFAPVQSHFETQLAWPLEVPLVLEPLVGEGHIWYFEFELVAPGQGAGTGPKFPTRRIVIAPAVGDEDPMDDLLLECEPGGALWLGGPPSLDDGGATHGAEGVGAHIPRLPPPRPAQSSS